MPINQLAGLSVPGEPALIVAQPFDKLAARRHREGHPHVRRLNPSNAEGPSDTDSALTGSAARKLSATCTS